MPVLAPPPPPPRIVEDLHRRTRADGRAQPGRNGAGHAAATASRRGRRPRGPSRRSPSRARDRARSAGDGATGTDVEASARSRSQDRSVDPRAAGRAQRDLQRVNYAALDADGRAQYDTARRFMEQAEEALKGGNLAFAGKLADKAATMGAVLVGRDGSRSHDHGPRSRLEPITLTVFGLHGAIGVARSHIAAALMSSAAIRRNLAETLSLSENKANHDEIARNSRYLASDLK